MSGQRRILVAYESDDQLRRIALSIDSSATISDLANEIAATLNIPRQGMRIEVGDEFELREQDGVNMILDRELVTVKRSSNPEIEIRSVLPTKPAKKAKELAWENSQAECAGRMKISFVNAEIARKYAINTAKEVSEVTFSDGAVAFDGQYVSGNTTLRSLQEEAVRVFGWDMDFNTSLQNDTCQHLDVAYCSCAVAYCSCAVAHEIEQHGLASTFHCRLSIDGTKCGHEDCPYSHKKLELEASSDPFGRLHCSVCGDAIGFPCPTCLEQAEQTGSGPESVIYCPVVQNAGCLHLHHAHCLRGRQATGTHSGGCPSGCPAAQFPREAVVFDMVEPHLILVWNGDKIGRVPIPKTAFLPENKKGLTTDKVVDIVQGYLTSQKGALPDLSLRIHFRNPASETVQFTHSTLVSVCSSSRHTNENHRRFYLFPGRGKSGSLTFNFLENTFAVDLHTDKMPIVGCGCTRLVDLFPLSDSEAGLEVTLYVVKRMNELNVSRQGDVNSKQLTYVANAAWHPSVHQSDRGMAAFLSSLYVLSDHIAGKGTVAEQRVLSMMYTLCRFPPAVRALAILIMNRVPQAYEKAPLAEAVLCLLRGLSPAAPPAIATRESRLFELSRLLLAHIVNSTAGPLPITSGSATEILSLVCASCQNRLTDPVFFESQIVQRQWALLHQPNQELYRPTSGVKSATIEELNGDHTIRSALKHSSSLSAMSVVILRIDKIFPVPPSASFRVEGLAREFVATITQANKTELVTRGPLDLKSASVIPPQVVLDQDGLLAVFTGRGCGSTRDVNFLRPTKGGDTEVDVNEVSQALEPIIASRKLENTWQIDSFDGVSAETRPPDEAIVLCLDLSYSMNERSGVSDSRKRSHAESAGHNIDADEAVRVITKGLTLPKVLEQAKEHLKGQHRSCLDAWRSIIYDGNSTAGKQRESARELVAELEILARRDVLRLVPEHDDKNEESVVSLKKMACFASACRHQLTAVVDFLISICGATNYFSVDTIGTHPFEVSLNLLDPITGDLMVDPVCPSNAPNTRMFMNRSSQSWFEAQTSWPLGHINTVYSSREEIRCAVQEWISGRELLPDSEQAEQLSIRFEHGGQVVTWRLQKNSPTNLLYQLAHRATRAAYSSFMLRPRSFSWLSMPIERSTSKTLGSIIGLGGSAIEAFSLIPHQRENRLVHIMDGSHSVEVSVILPPDAPILSLLSYAHADGSLTMSETLLWSGLTYLGDNVRTGTSMNNEDRIDKGRAGSGYSYPGTLPPINYEWWGWRWILSASQDAREKSRYLTRLHLLKELFDVFVNRISSFDTKVSLVLGLVTFSNVVHVKQELTPIFENFRKELDTVSANGDTALYDALDQARVMLANYQRDLPILRRRIIIVSDGDDNMSIKNAKDVCKSLQDAGVLVDSVQVGTMHSATLHAISVATGGYRFFPRTSLGDALSIFDLETMLNSGERPYRRPMVLFRTLREYEDISRYPVDMITMDQFPKRAEHLKLRESVKSAASTAVSIMTKAYSNDDRMKRIMQEIKALVADPHPNIDIYVNDQDISFLKVILEAPKDSVECPYKGGCFLLTCDFPQGYPRDPPEIRFVTFILHPNVSKQGKVCVAELGRLWSSDITLKEIFNLIYGLLLEPDLENPLEIQASLKYYDDDGTYALLAANAVAEHAWKTREDWRRELEDEDEPMIEADG